MAPEGLLAPLAGLNRKPPVLHYRGRHYPLSERHRVIMTGNPSSYEGRHLDSTLSSQTVTLFYHPLSDQEQAQLIIMPGLPASLPDSMKTVACERLLVLLNEVKALATKEQLTPRDINDVLSIMEHIYRNVAHDEIWTTEKVNAWVRRAFMDCMWDSFSQQQQESLNVVNDWYQTRFPEDTSIFYQVDRTFTYFFNQLQNSQSGC